MTHPPARSSRARRTRAAWVAVALAVVGGLSACGDDPFLIRWTARPDTVLLYSLARPELNLPSGFNFRPNQRGVVRVEAPTATGSWDVALDTRGGQLVWLPPGALGVSSRARVTALEGFTFDEVRDAPSDTAVYSALDPVPVKPGTIYVVRTGSGFGAFGSVCVYYAKIQPLVLDVESGTLTFVYDASPICNSLRLVPPD